MVLSQAHPDCGNSVLLGCGSFARLKCQARVSHILRIREYVPPWLILTCVVATDACGDKQRHARHTFARGGLLIWASRSQASPIKHDGAIPADENEEDARASDQQQLKTRTFAPWKLSSYTSC